VCNLTEWKGGVRYRSVKEGVSGTMRHEGATGRPVAGLGRDGTGSGGARQGKIGGSSFVAVMGGSGRKGSGPGVKEKKWSQP
jgi:hypothetical protein